jgi:hypothetical protein
MKRYVLVNDYDGNDCIELEAKTEVEALYEALERLGWNLAEEEDED